MSPLARLAPLVLLGCTPGLKNLETNDTGALGYDDASVYGALSISPVELDFGYVAAGETATSEIVLTNIGGEVVNVWSLQLSDGDVFELIEVSATGAIEASESLVLTVEFSPEYEFDYQDSLEMSTDAEGAAAITYAIAGTAVPGASTGDDTGGSGSGDDTGGSSGPTVVEMDVSPASVAFPATTVGDTESRSITLSNPGPDPLVLTGVSFSSSEFTWANDFSLSHTFNGYDSESITVRYTPTNEGADSGTANLSYTDAAGDPQVATVDLSGSGEEDCSICAPSISVDTGGASDYNVSMTSLLCTTASQDIEISNNGDKDLQITNVYVNNDGVFTAGVFSVDTGGMSSTVAPGGSTDFTLEYLATEFGVDLEYWSAGLDYNTLHIVSNDPVEGDYVISLYGTGTCVF